MGRLSVIIKQIKNLREIMRIGINASFLRKVDTGTGQVTVSFLRQLIQSERKKEAFLRNQFILYLEEDFDWKVLGIEKEDELQQYFKKRIFLPQYRRDDLIRKIWWEKWLLPQKAKEDDCQIFFSLYQSATVFKNKKIRHLMLVHDVIWKIFPQYLNNMRKKIYYSLVDAAIVQADRILTVSQSSKNDIKEWFGLEEKKIQMAPIDCDEIFKKAVADEKKDLQTLKHYGVDNSNFIFYVGGFDQRKNVGFLLEAYGQFFQMQQKTAQKNIFSFPDLILAGKFNAQLVPLVENLPEKIDQVRKKYRLPKDKIKMIGFVVPADLPAFYFRAGLFCFPSLYEGFGLPPLEAFNCCCPVLMNRNSSLSEVAGENNEIAFPMKDEKILAEKIREVCLDEKKRSLLIEAGKQRVAKFSWEKFLLIVEREWDKLK